MVAKFTFRLEKVKQVKTIYEEQAKLDWAAANRRLSTSIERLNHLYSKRSNASQYGYDQLDVSLRLSLYNYLNKMDRIIENQIEIVTTIKHEVEKKRNSGTRPPRETSVGTFRRAAI